ncbi:MAG: efflux RND transporter periplasmic adaptor subunit [Thermoanaerobacterales bacterium]|nr:efflux RND transporter periplasmic adaptor subunit [Bacillota bacterium]MDI6907592.1 efflux RND transporter periplasmic adaptor subunit [Thermoanaerobacterales bacterium]
MRGLWLPGLLLLLAVSLLGCDGRGRPLTANGTIEADEVRVVAEVGGTVQEMLVEEGDTVRAGQEVARLDPRILEAQQAQAAAGLEAARAARDEAAAGSRAQEIASARREAERLDALRKAAAEDLILQEKTLQKYRRLYEAQAVSEQELTVQENSAARARAQAEAATAAYEAAAARLSLAEAGARAETLARLEAQVGGAEAGVEAARLNLEKATLRAPVAGMVVGRNFAPGEVVRPGAEVVTLLDTSRLWLDVYVPENRLGEVRMGQKVGVAVDGFPGRKFAGRVTFIAPEAEFTPKNVQTKEDRVRLVFRVRVELLDGKDQLRPGMPADVTFNGGSR